MSNSMSKKPNLQSTCDRRMDLDGSMANFSQSYQIEFDL